MVVAERREPTAERSDAQGVEVRDAVGGHPGHRERAEAGMAIGSGVFAPFLGWREVVVDREEQGRPFEAGGGPRIWPAGPPPPPAPARPFRGGGPPPPVLLPHVCQ